MKGDTQSTGTIIKTEWLWLIPNRIGTWFAFCSVLCPSVTEWPLREFFFHSLWIQVHQPKQKKTSFKLMFLRLHYHSIFYIVFTIHLKIDLIKYISTQIKNHTRQSLYRSNEILSVRSDVSHRAEFININVIYPFHSCVRVVHDYHYWQVIVINITKCIYYYFQLYQLVNYFQIF